jgi:hypothetical protein
MRRSLERARSELAERLRARRGEIEEALLTRTYAIADPKEASDPEYVQGLRAAVSAALDFGLSAVEHGEERSPQVPVLLLAQARLAARNNIPLDTVLRRYFAGYTTLGDFIVQEAGAANLKEAWLERLLREQAALFDRFLATVTEEHSREGDAGRASVEERRAEKVRRLLDGELVDSTGLGYELDGHHLGLIAVGPGAQEVLRSLAGALDRRLLSIRHDETTVWAWLGGRRPLDAELLESRIASGLPREDHLAMGEPGEGSAAWRLTHRQARAVLPVALRGNRPVVRYGDAALLAAVLQDDLLATSLRQLFIEPLTRERDEGAMALETLRAYFAAKRNATSAAAALGISRQAVNGRLRMIEERLGRTINGSGLELEVALRRRDLEEGRARPCDA